MTKLMKLTNTIENNVNDSKNDEIENILKEYDEDDFNNFEELDEDLY